jgi:hypothetical protein
MANQVIGLGTVENDGTGDNLRVALDKVNDNFLEIYTLIGDASSLTSGISATATVVTLTAPTISGVVGGTITSATITTLTGTTFSAGTLALSAGSITDSSGAISFGNENLTTTGVVTAASLDISGNVDVDGTLETDALTIDGVTLSETIADTVGAMVGSNTETGIAVTYEDGDNTLDFVLGTSQTTITSLTNTSLVIGRDADNDIDFATDNNIIFRAGGADQIKLIDGAIAPVTDNDIDLGTASLEFKNAYFDGIVRTNGRFDGALTGEVTGNAATATTLATARTIAGVSFDGSANINLPGVNTAGNQNTTGSAATLTTARTIGGTSFDGSANIAVALSAAATALANARTIHGVSFDGTANIDLTEVVQDTVGAMFSSNTETNITATYQDSDGTIDLVIGTLNQNTTGNAATATALETARTIHGVSFDGTANIDLTEVVQDTVGAMFSSNTETGITVTYQDADGTVDFVIGTLNQDTTGSAATLTTARTIGGVSFDGSANINLPGVNTAGNQNTSGTAAVATLATTVTITDNESTNENNALIFTAGGDIDGGNLGLESDGTLTYNPSTGKVTATGFVGTLTGNVTGNASGTAATVTGAAQTNITSVGTLTALQVDNININLNTISSTAGTDLLITPVAGQQIVLDGTIIIDAGVVTGATSITSTAFVGDITGDVTGNADTATALATARTIAGVSFDGSANIALAPTDLTSVTAVAGEINALDLGSTAVGTAIASKAVVLDANKDYTGIRNFTASGGINAGIHTFVATDAITSVEHAGRILLLGEVGGNADVVLTLPDATGSGNIYEFIVSVTMGSNTYKIVCPDSDNVINGTMQNMDLDGTAVTIFSTVAASDTITLNGGTQGGQVGDTLRLIDMAADTWHVSGIMRTPTGANPATPFSEAVS